MSSRRVGLALGGGSVRGMAHVGLLSVLEREGIQIDCVAGTSVGSVVGAAYAAGLRGEKLIELALRLRWRHIAWPTLSRLGYVSFSRLESFLVRKLGDLSFADLQIPFAAVAADLETCQPVILKEGRVARAVRASASIPGIVTPVEHQGRLLVDGGVTKNLPISVARELGADVVIAVNLVDPVCGRPRTRWQMIMWAFEALVARTGDQPATADVCLAIHLTGLASLVRVSQAREMMALGAQAAESALPAIKAAIR